MNNKITAPHTPTLASQQGAAIAALSMLLTEYSDLPPAYITMHPRADTAFILILDNPQDAEIWRTALGIDPATVDLGFGDGRVWTQIMTTYRDVPVRLIGNGVPLSAETAEARQEAPAAEQVAA